MNMTDVELVAKLAEVVERAARETAAKTAAAAYPVNWVKLDRYVELTGDSADAVMARRKTGKWLDGNQCKVVDGRLWISLSAVEGWVENW
jgi:hypothetical protein